MEGNDGIPLLVCGLYCVSMNINIRKPAVSDLVNDTIPCISCIVDLTVGQLVRLVCACKVLTMICILPFPNSAAFFTSSVMY